MSNEIYNTKTFERFVESEIYYEATTRKLYVMSRGYLVYLMTAPDPPITKPRRKEAKENP